MIMEIILCLFQRMNKQSILYYFKSLYVYQYTDNIPCFLTSYKFGNYY